MKTSSAAVSFFRTLFPFTLFLAVLFGGLFFLSFYIQGEALPDLRTFSALPESAAPADESARVRVILDAGHGGVDGGCVSANKVLEKELNLALAKKTGEFLELFGAEVLYTRTDDRLLTVPQSTARRKMQDLLARVTFAREAPDAVFVSIHQNALPQKNVRGLQVFYSPHSTDSRVLALLLQKSVQTNLQPDNHREIKEAGSGIYVLDHLSQPAILVECGFLSNPEEEALLSAEDYRTKLAFLIAKSAYQVAKARLDGQIS